MNTIIVPVDFSETSVNAATYAFQLLEKQTDATIILHHVTDKASQKDEAAQKLNDLKSSVGANFTGSVEVLVEQGGSFVEELETLARHRDAHLVIMGITERSALGQTLLGSNTLRMVEKKVCPVLIVPPDAKYTKFENVLLTSDFKDVQKSTPSTQIKNVLKALQPNFYVLNVDSNHYVAITEEYQAQKEALANMFSEFKPEFFFMGLYDVDDAINQFAADYKVDLIILIHKEQSLFSKLFAKSHTKKFAYESSLPILAVSE